MSSLSCSQCGRSAPTDSGELQSWKHGDLVSAGEIDDVTATMLLCPDCVEEEHAGEFEAGEPG